MDPRILALLIPILALMIPIVAIVLSSFEKMYQMRLKHSGGTSAEMMEMKERMREMEQRIQTLQEIVIATDYDARRKIEMATSEMPVTASSSTSTARSTRQQQIQ